jgi:hypothetical protein
MFELFFNFLKNDLRRSKISLTFPKRRSEKSFSEKKLLGIETSWRIRYAKNSRFCLSLFQLQMSIQLYDQLLSKPLKILEYCRLKGSEIGLQKYLNFEKLQLYMQTCVRDVYVMLRMVNF